MESSYVLSTTEDLAARKAYRLASSVVSGASEIWRRGPGFGSEEFADAR